MAVGGFFSVPEIDPTTATDQVFGSFIKERRSMEKAAWAGEQLVDLAGLGPEELPPCFLAVQAEALSPRTGWETEHGKWEPKDMYIDKLFRLYLANPLFRQGKSILLMKTRLVFRPKDGSKSDLAIDMYNTIHPTTLVLEEDMALCHFYRVPKEKGKGVVRTDASSPLFWEEGTGGAPPGDSPSFWQSLLEISDDPSHEKSAFSYFNEDLGWDMPSSYYFGGPNKRRRSKPPVGGSGVWDSFTKIYTKDPDVVYAACHHCGRLMKLKGGTKCGTKSLLRHDESCPCKPVID